MNKALFLSFCFCLSLSGATIVGESAGQVTEKVEEKSYVKHVKKLLYYLDLDDPTEEQLNDGVQIIKHLLLDEQFLSDLENNPQDEILEQLSCKLNEGVCFELLSDYLEYDQQDKVLEQLLCKVKEFDYFQNKILFRLFLLSLIVPELKMTWFR